MRSAIFHFPQGCLFSLSQHRHVIQDLTVYAPERCMTASKFAISSFSKLELSRAAILFFSQDSLPPQSQLIHPLQ